MDMALEQGGHENLWVTPDILKKIPFVCVWGGSWTQSLMNASQGLYHWVPSPVTGYELFRMHDRFLCLFGRWYWTHGSICQAPGPALNIFSLLSWATGNLESFWRLTFMSRAMVPLDIIFFCLQGRLLFFLSEASSPLCFYSLPGTKQARRSAGEADTGRWGKKPPTNKSLPVLQQTINYEIDWPRLGPMMNTYSSGCWEHKGRFGLLFFLINSVTLCLFGLCFQIPLFCF